MDSEKVGIERDTFTRYCLLIEIFHSTKRGYSVAKKKCWNGMQKIILYSAVVFLSYSFCAAPFPEYVRPLATEVGLASLTGSGLLCVYQRSLAKQLHAARLQTNNLVLIKKLHHKIALVKKCIGLGVSVSFAMALIWYLSQKEKHQPLADHTDEAISQQDQLVLDGAAKKIQKQFLKYRFNKKVKSALTGEEENAIKAMTDDSLSSRTDNYIGLLDDLENRIAKEQDSKKKISLERLLQTKKLIIQECINEKKKREMARLSQSKIDLQKQLLQLNGREDLETQFNQAKIQENLESVTANIAWLNGDKSTAEKHERLLYAQKKHRLALQNALELVTREHEERKRKLQEAVEHLECLPEDEKKISVFSAGGLFNAMEEGEQYAVTLDDQDVIVYKKGAYLYKINPDKSQQVLSFSQPIDNTQLCVRHYPKHAWKVYHSATNSPMRMRPLKDILASYSVSVLQEIDLSSQTTYLTQMARGIKITSADDCGGRIYSLMAKARQTQQAHSAEFGLFNFHHNLTYAGEGPLLLKHHPIMNTHDSTCVGHSLAYALTHRDFDGAAISQVLANQFLASQDDLIRFLDTLGGNRALVFDKSVQSCANLTGRPIFVWQMYHIVAAKDLAENSNKSYLLRPYDGDAHRLGGCCGANLFLPKAGIKHSFDKAIHLFLILWPAGGSHCEVLDSIDFTLDKLIALNLENASAMIKNACELVNTINARSQVEDSFKLSGLTQVTRIHLELYVLGLLSQYHLADKTMVENLTQLSHLNPSAVQHVYEGAATFVDFCINQFTTSQNFVETSSLLLWSAFHYKWFSFLAPSDIEQFAYKYWKAIIKNRLEPNSELIDDLSRINVWFDQNGFPLLFDQGVQSFSKARLSDAIKYASSKEGHVLLGSPSIERPSGEEISVARGGSGQLYVPVFPTVKKSNLANGTKDLAGFAGVSFSSISIPSDYKNTICLWKKKTIGKEVLPGLEGVVVKFSTEDLPDSNPSINLLLDGDTVYILYSAAHAPYIPARLIKAASRH